MKFFFPDSQDQIDPSFDFSTEAHSIHRVRQRDDRYAHETLTERCYDGLLVSKTIVDGVPGSTGKYTLAQRHRLYREGIQRFFRLNTVDGPPMVTMGDCGAFSYVREETPPYTPDQVIDFYEECGFDLGISVDHVILGFDPAADDRRDHERHNPWRERQRLTLELAHQFLHRCHTRRVQFEPVGVAQGWSPKSYAQAVGDLQDMGFTRIALGGMVPLKTPEILSCLQAIDDARDSSTQLHLLGVTRCERIDEFTTFGVVSFDSTSPFRQAFKDDRDNYYALDRTYTAIRVPQVDGNAKLKAAIRAGKINQTDALRVEQTCLRRLHAYDHGDTELSPLLDALASYAELVDAGSDRTEAYRQILEDQPWKHCSCGICGEAGVDVAIFRGSERNKRRGFHNLYVFSRRLQRELAGTSP